ncbi:hypothetical protein [Photorhabdus hindustanensis]|uniref:hypothetical protein n=1 Tax=Photorhabdus hindustanensis TaxID=2918802 RepID=UPI0030DB2D63
MGTDNAVWHNRQTAPHSGSSWSGWISLNGNVTSKPVVYINTDGRLEVFARGTDNALASHTIVVRLGIPQWQLNRRFSNQIIWNKSSFAQDERHLLARYAKENIHCASSGQWCLICR